MNRIKKWILPGLVFLLPGCVSYSTIELDVLKPADVALPVEIASVVVVDNAYPFRPEDKGIHKIKVPRMEYTIDSIFVEDFGMQINQSLVGSLQSKAFFDSVYIVNQPLNSPEKGEPMAQLSPIVVDSLCAKYNAQAVIELGHYEYGTVINVIDIEGQYYATLDARTTAYWKIHNNLSNDILDVHLQRDTIFWDGAGLTVGNAVEKLPAIRNALKEAALYAGFQYSDYVSPTWQSETRFFFKKGHPLFYEAQIHMNRGDWDEAGKVWYYIYENGKKKQKARAAYNLALSQEIKGNFLEATSWAYRALEHFQEAGGLGMNSYEHKMAKDYYIELSARLQEKKKLDKQYGIYE
jgi:hypothetical protein